MRHELKQVWCFPSTGAVSIAQFNVDFEISALDFRNDTKCVYTLSDVCLQCHLRQRQRFKDIETINVNKGSGKPGQIENLGFIGIFLRSEAAQYFFRIENHWHGNIEDLIDNEKNTIEDKVEPWRTPLCTLSSSQIFPRCNMWHFAPAYLNFAEISLLHKVFQIRSLLTLSKALSRSIKSK